jgi:hypothetical protein
MKRARHKVRKEKGLPDAHGVAPPAACRQGHRDTGGPDARFRKPVRPTSRPRRVPTRTESPRRQPPDAMRPRGSAELRVVGR